MWSVWRGKVNMQRTEWNRLCEIVLYEFCMKVSGVEADQIFSAMREPPLHPDRGAQASMVGMSVMVALAVGCRIASRQDGAFLGSFAFTAHQRGQCCSAQQGAEPDNGMDENVTQQHRIKHRSRFGIGRGNIHRDMRPCRIAVHRCHNHPDQRDQQRYA